MMKILKRGKLLVFCALLCLLFATVASAAGSGDVASAVESPSLVVVGVFPALPD